MPIRRTIPFDCGTFFITFTCHQWLCLIERVNGYDIVYAWFDLLTRNGHFIHGYVIMPNHIHMLISFRQSHQRINTVIGNGKRFMAYEIIRRLKQHGDVELLAFLNDHVEIARKENKKLHEVWELSFHWNECHSRAFISQKLDYMHKNPCSKKWKLCLFAGDYLHSSARYYMTGTQGIYPVTDFMLMDDVRLI